MYEQEVQDFNKYMWRHSVVRMASAFALTITLIGGYHALKATEDTANFLSFSSNTETTIQQENANNELPHEIYHEGVYAAESFALAGLAGYIALKQHKRNKKHL
jgi:hypothetical protein